MSKPVVNSPQQKYIEAFVVFSFLVAVSIGLIVYGVAKEFEWNAQIRCGLTLLSSVITFTSSLYAIFSALSTETLKDIAEDER